jgi:hypothetical protein
MELCIEARSKVGMGFSRLDRLELGPSHTSLKGIHAWTLEQSADQSNYDPRWFDEIRPVLSFSRHLISN